MSSAPPARPWRVPFLDLEPIHQQIRADVDAVWDDVVAQGVFIGGGHVERFEQAWAEYCGADHAIGVANGTDSIELILRSLGIGPGDEVVIPANTFIATVEAAVACGATPVLVDVDPATLLVTAAQIEPALTDRTAALVPVHLYGQPCPMDEINALAATRGIAVIEDAAQAHGASWRERRAGSLATAASFSFYPGKNLGAFGDGGAVVTDDAALAARVRSLANHGRADGDHVTHPLLGRNSRLDALQAGVLLAKLDHLDKWNADRRAARHRFVDRLDGVDGVTPVAERAEATSVWHLNVVRVRDRAQVIDGLATAGIEARVHYPQPCHHHPMLSEQQTLPAVEAAADEILSLPMFPSMSDVDIDRTCDALATVLADTR